MLHLPALPGSPQAQHSLQQIESMLLEEASLLVETGFDACIVENFGDTPFFGERVAPITIASMTRLIASLRRAQPGLLTGVNVLRNDARAALAVATACEASFIRVNVHVGTTATDQGVLEGRAAQTMRLRRELQANVQVWADVHVKHGRSLTHEHIEQEALDCVHRGGADAIIVSGHGTGQEVWELAPRMKSPARSSASGRIRLTAAGCCGLAPMPVIWPAPAGWRLRKTMYRLARTT
jgi:membrane complex biogenesis BtpA family protein